MSEAALVPALSARGVRKDFPGTTALDGVTFELLPGEVHSLVGGNGCGKSTLMKILAGVLPADAGTLDVGGETFDLRHFSAALASRQGLHFVHQESTTFGDMTVAENLSLGSRFETDPIGRIRWRALRRRVRSVLERFEIDARPDDLVESLRPATQTMVAIARALQDQEEGGGGVLALDEPTASLPPDEVNLVLRSLRRFAGQGQSIVFISHRLEEVIAVSDRISVFRDGRNAAIVEREGLTPDDLTELIVGSPIEVPPARPRAARAGEAAALEVRQLRKGSLAGVDLAVEAGELVGVAGINGSGRSTLLRTIFGVEDPDGGEILLGGEPIRFAGPKEAIAAGVAYVPEDRAENGLFPELSVIENLSAAAIRDYAPHRLLQHRRERRDAEAAISRFLIRTESPEAEVATLSGGNQQKIVLARWMRKNPRLLLLDEPTHGVDVGARAEISQLIRQAVGEGTAVIVVSSDFEELVELCDRVVALRGGVVDGELGGSDLSLDRLNQLMHTDRSRT